MLILSWFLFIYYYYYYYYHHHHHYYHHYRCIWVLEWLSIRTNKLHINHPIIPSQRRRECVWTTIHVRYYLCKQAIRILSMESVPCTLSSRPTMPGRAARRSVEIKTIGRRAWGSGSINALKHLQISPISPLWLWIAKNGLPNAGIFFLLIIFLVKIFVRERSILKASKTASRFVLIMFLWKIFSKNIWGRIVKYK